MYVCILKMLTSFSILKYMWDFNYTCFLHLLIIFVVWYFQLAEKYFIQANSIKDAIDMYNMASKWEEAYRVSVIIQLTGVIFGE